MGLMAFHVALLIVAILSRKHINFQMFLFLLACKLFFFFKHLKLIYEFCS